MTKWQVFCLNWSCTYLAAFSTCLFTEVRSIKVVERVKVSAHYGIQNCCWMTLIFNTFSIPETFSTRFDHSGKIPRHPTNFLDNDQFKFYLSNNFYKFLSYELKVVKLYRIRHKKQDKSCLANFHNVIIIDNFLA